MARMLLRSRAVVKVRLASMLSRDDVRISNSEPRPASIFLVEALGVFAADVDLERNADRERR